MSASKKNRKGARKCPASTPSEPFSPLFAAYAEWIEARAGVAKDNAFVSVESSEANRRLNAMLDRVSKAEWRMLRTPSRMLADIRLRCEIVSMMFDDAAEAGEPVDNRHLLMLRQLLLEIHKGAALELIGAEQ